MIVPAYLATDRSRLPRNCLLQLASRRIVTAYLSHGGEESLWVEESSHPEDVGATTKTPVVKLMVAVNQLSEPEPQRAGVP